MIYLVEITAYDAGLPGTRTLRYASKGWAGNGAPGFFDGRLLASPSVRRNAWGAGTTQGLVETGYGLVRLSNPDGGLDGLIDYGFDGRELRILIGAETDAYSSFVTVLTGTMEQPTFTDTEVSIRIRDRLFELDKPVQATRYAGTNSGATGQEGLADDLKGRVKPRTYGRVLNITPPLVNSTQLIYQVNDGAVQDVPAVYEGGLAIGTRGADYTSLSDMTTNAPAAGAYRVWPAGGMFRLGSSPTLPITADVDEGAAASNRTAAQILKRIVEGPGGIASGDVSAADVSALDTANSAPLGIHIAADTSVREVLSAIATSVGAWCGFDRLGDFRMQRLTAPSGTPVATFRVLGRGAVATATTGDIVSLQRIPTDDDGRGVPAYRVNLRHRRNWTRQDSGQLATSVAQARRAFLAEEWRTAVSTDTAVQTKHLRSPELTFDSLIVAESDALTEAARRQVLYGVRRDRLRLRTILTPALAAVIDLGAVVSVEWPRYGYTSGRSMTVLGIDTGVEPGADAVDLELWG